MIMKRIAFSSLALALMGVASQAASITVSAPPTVSGSFDVDVNATDVFAGSPGDALLAFGFNVDVGSPLFTFTGATLNSTYFAAPPAGCCVGTDVVATDNAAFVFGLEAGDFTEPLLLATLHFSVNGTGSTTVGISADNSADPNQGLIFLFADPENFSDSARVTAAAAATPEPATLSVAALSLAGLYAFRRRFSSK
jgi:hypothetical protein